jgi:hypothetical protein
MTADKLQALSKHKLHLSCDIALLSIIQKQIYDIAFLCFIASYQLPHKSVRLIALNPGLDQLTVDGVWVEALLEKSNSKLKFVQKNPNDDFIDLAVSTTITYRMMSK